MHEAPGSPIWPTRIERVGQPVKLQALVGSLPAGGAPMKPGSVGLLTQTSTFCAHDIVGCFGFPLLGSVHVPPDWPKPTSEQDRPSCCPNISQASHQVYLVPGRLGLSAPRIVWLRAPKN